MVERLFLAVPRGCLQFVIVIFPDHTHLLFLKTVAATLTQLHVWKEKQMGFLHFCFRTDITLLVLIHHCLALGWSWEKNYVKMCNFGRFLRF